MKTILFVAILFVSSFVQATSFGHQKTAVIKSVGGKPAICLPDDAKEDFPVGWITLSESYGQGSWGVNLRNGRKPLTLSAGECVVYGDIPEGYERSKYQIVIPNLIMKRNRTYVFRLSNSEQPTDTYLGIFCISEKPDYSWEYLQYLRLSDGQESAPSCDERLHGYGR